MSSNVLDGAYFDVVETELNIAFVQNLTLTKSTRSGRPEPFILLDVHKKLITNLLGWKRANGTRLYRRCYFSTARKNAKTQIAAAIGLLMLVMDDEAQPEIYIAAKGLEQSSKVFEAACDMINANEELSALLTIKDYQKKIINSATGGILRALTSDGKTKHGSNPSAVVIDEFHTWDEYDRELYDALTTGSAARRSPLFIIITTAGVDEYSMCGVEYQHAKNVLNGTITDPTYLPMIYELPKDADWTDETLWHLANPALEILNMDLLREQRDNALNLPSEQTKFRRLALNQWVNAKSQWIPLAKWDACKWNPETAIPYKAAA